MNYLDVRDINLVVRRESDEYILYSQGIITNQIRKYPRLPEKRCKYCHAPYIPCNKHSALLDSQGNPLLENINVIGYYIKQPFDRLTEDIVRFRTTDYNRPESLSFKILEALLNFYINNTMKSYQVITCPPSRDNRFILLLEMISRNLKIDFINPTTFLNYDRKLHQESHIRNTITYQQRLSLVKKLYLPKEGVEFKKKSILIIDDRLY